MITYKPFALVLTLIASLYLPSAMAERSLIVLVYPHDELHDVSDEQLNRDFFQHWIEEMRLITTNPIEVIFQRNVPNITDIDYEKMTPDETYTKFFREASMQPAWDQPSLITRTMLLTKNHFGKTGKDDAIQGLAYLGGRVALASVLGYTVAAHELGHTLMSTHEDSQVLNNPWFCETYTYPERNSLRSNCYRYSDKNRQTIADYIDSRTP